MKKLMTGMLLLTALLLSGCDGGDVKEPLIPIAKVEPVFEPGAGLLPLPNDILFGGSLDLTLNIPVDDATDFSDPKVALSGLDGWSAVAPFAISFRSTDPALDLDPSTVVPGSSVRMFQVNLLRPEVAPGVIAPTGPVIGIEHELVPGVEFFATYSAQNTVAILPLKPLTAQASYVVVVTNSILDTNGNAILPDGQYAIAKGTTPISSALEPVRQLVSQLESVIETAGVNRNEIVLSMQFTVQSIGNVMAAAKGFYIDFPLSLGAIPSTSFSSLFTDTTPFTGIGAADLYKGEFTLNYYLGAPSEMNPTAPLNTFWKTAEMVPGAEGLVPNPAPGGNLSYANPLPELNGQETVPLLVSMPKAALGCVKPATGYPVVIFQHGITGNRTNVIGIADALAAPPSCTAAVAMDMPLHGIAADNAVHLGLQAASNGALGIFEGYTEEALRERTFGVDFVDNSTGAPGADDIPDGSGTHTINLANLLVIRDNNRQAAMDLLALEKAIPFMDIDGIEGADFDVSKVSFIGHSLGGMVGSVFIAHSDTIKAAALAHPGGGTGLMLNGSTRFGPRIRAGVAAAAGMSTTDPAFAAVLAQFLFVAQTVVDASDPLNSAVLALSNDVPTLMLQVLNDSVIPNTVAGAPLSGTQPMAATFELETTVATEAGFVQGSRLFSKLNQGLHSTVLTPDDGEGNPIGLLNVTIELQTQIVSFLSSGGAGVQVTDPQLLEEVLSSP